MVLLTFRLGPERYGVDVASVQRVLPAVHLKTLPHAPPYVAGLANLHGRPLPVIDLCLLALGRPCQAAMSTRIIEVTCRRDQDAVALGLLAEAVCEVIRVDKKAFTPTGVQFDAGRYLGPVLNLDGTLLQKVEVEELLPEDVLHMLAGASKADEAAP
jgi:chemotaxis-related protein WspB